MPPTPTRIAWSSAERCPAPGEPAEGYEAPRLSLSAPEVDLGEIQLSNLGPGIYAGELVMPTSGTWKAQVSLRTSEFDNPVRTVRFDVP